MIIIYSIYIHYISLYHYDHKYFKSLFPIIDLFMTFFMIAGRTKHKAIANNYKQNINNKIQRNNV